jgi:hypothetical protein
MSDLLEQWRDPVFNDRHEPVPAALASRLTEMADEITGRHMYYERMHVLFAVAGVAKDTNPTAFQLNDPPSDAEKQFGAVLGQAFHQGCQLADVAFAAELPPEQVVAIGKRTIRRTKWLEHL